MKKYLWIGAIASRAQLTLMTEKGNRQSTAYNLQQKMIDGFNENNVFPDVLVGHMNPPFPKYKDIVIRGEKYVKNDGTSVVSVPYINLPLINLLTKALTLAFEGFKWAVKYRDDEKVIIVYGLHSPFLQCAKLLKKFYCNLKVCIIVPDLPEYMNAKLGKLKFFLKKLDRQLIDNCTENADYIVLFSEHMKENLNMKSKPYCVMEGIANYDEEKYDKQILKNDYSSNKKIILLTGALNKVDGVDIIVDSFSNINNTDWQLWITGYGELESYIKQVCENDDRIKFWGYLPNYDDLLDLQRQATTLAVMVPPTSAKSRFFFPSKMMEYLVTGLPVSCFKLECIPSEYFEHLFFFDQKNIIDTFEIIFSLTPEEKIIMAKNRKRLLLTKSPKSQMENILNLIC